MKSILLCALAVLVTTVSSQAAYISGVVQFDPQITPDTGSLNQAVTFVSMKSTSGVGFFSAFPNTPWEPLAVPAAPGAVGKPIALSGLDFGTFSGVVAEDTAEFMAPTGYFRVMRLAGNWSPGTTGLFTGFTDAVQAEFFISLNRDLAAGALINSTVVFYATGLPAAVPEPALGVLLPIGLAAAGMIYRRRQKTALSKVVG
jgi:hypothetical protein